MFSKLWRRPYIDVDTDYYRIVHQWPRYKLLERPARRRPHLQSRAFRDRSGKSLSKRRRGKGGIGRRSQNGSSLTQGLVGYYTFDGKDTPWSSATAGTAIDHSGNGRHASSTTLTRSGWPTIGKIGQALNFSGLEYFNLTSGFTSAMVDGRSWPG